MLNNITIMGRFTREPELKQTGSGTSVVSFTIACDRDFGSQGEKQTDFINCVAWRTTADFISKYFHKGSLCVVNGSLQIRRWKDNQDNNRETAEINVNNIYFAESKKDSSPGPSIIDYPSKPNTDRDWGQSEDGDLPF